MIQTNSQSSKPTFTAISLRRLLVAPLYHKSIETHTGKERRERELHGFHFMPTLTSFGRLLLVSLWSFTRIFTVGFTSSFR